MPVGSGHLDLWGGLRGSSDAGLLGAGVDYAHRLSGTTSLFARGAAGYGWDSAGAGWRAEAIGGLRMRW